MTDFLARNLAALRTTNPRLACVLEATCPDPARYRIIPSRSGIPTLEYIDDNQKPVLWHSRYEPLQEVQRDLAAIDHAHIYVPLLMGIGLGYGLRLLWDQYRQEFFDAVILEYDRNLLRIALQITCLDDVLSDPRLHIHAGGDLQAWTETTRRLMPAIMSCSLQVIPHAPSQRCHAPFYQSAMEALQQRIRHTEAEFDLMKKSGPLIQENMLRNLPVIVCSMGLDAARGMLRGKPALVVAAGPSLDRNIHHLRGQEDHIAIIAVDTAFRTLQKLGIRPHLVVTTDPTELNLRHFEGIEPAPETILAFDPEVYSAIPNGWRHRTLFLNLEKCAYTRWLENICGPFGFLPKGGSVGHTAFYLARELGADPIIFAGLDLAFDPRGGSTHTSSSALHRRYDAIPSGASTADLGPRPGAGTLRENIVWVPGADGNPVPTSQIMAIYIRQFAEEFAHTPARLIDATEGGALLPGTEILSLADALLDGQKSTAHPTNSIHDLFQEIKPPSRDLKNLQSGLDRIAQQLNQAELVAQTGLRLATGLASRISPNKDVRQTAEWAEMENCFAQLYHGNEIKIAMEQALFEAVYQFIQKEHPDQIELRLRKYGYYFQAFGGQLPRFRECLGGLIKRI